MYCQNCGTELPESGVCPKCSPAPNQYAAPVQQPAPAKSTRADKFSKGSRTWAALVSAALVFPASMSVAIDLSFHRYDFWFGFVIGAVLVAWVCLVLPVLKITPPPVTAVICFVTMMGYLFYIMAKCGAMEWLFQKALPLTILFIVFVSLDVMLLSMKKINWLSFASLASFESAIYIVAIEATAKQGFTALRWSPIIACGFISVSAVFLAFAYIGKIHKEDK